MPETTAQRRIRVLAAGRPPVHRTADRAGPGREDGLGGFGGWVPDGVRWADPDRGGDDLDRVVHDDLDADIVDDDLDADIVDDDLDADIVDGQVRDAVDPDAAGGRPGRSAEAAQRSGWVARVQRRGPWGRLARRWVPESLQESRVDPGRRGAVLLTAVAALAAVAAAVGVWRDRPEPRPVDAAAVSVAAAVGIPTSGGTVPAVPRSSTRGGGEAAGGAGGAGSAAAAGTAGRPDAAGDPTRAATAGRPGASAAGGPDTADPSTATPPIVVSVTGRVARPGLVRLPAGSRVADALAAAGGARGDAELTGLNLAQRLQDGQSVVVAARGTTPVPGGSTVVGGAPAPVGGGSSGPGAGAGPRTSGAGVPGGPVDLNTADAATLDGLPGVGPVTATAIVAWRQQHGRFDSVEQLQEIDGIGPAKYAQLAPRVTV
ncbi:ComEA family DNA-binding protein [Nakamurella endophytica]|uniref:Helix-hairpin-helix DNA-binding motif class 1 domain-containing protein n=1 Tax=Nakamurella endophytica TaxID=1748367 RepID=A0A917SIX5_9ACTN|nr:helix-hairpin-helix domain-containing protein [Nakamurella endophytica]GGL84729.1 hypothetical protein GCM10011594_00400 [Nakamurella endophytica]